MQITKQIQNGALAIIFMAALLMPLTGLRQLASAAADTCTWTGGGADNNLSTTGNWTGCDNSNIPEHGDILSFPADTTVSITNDTAIDIAGVVVADSTSGETVTIDGDFNLEGLLDVGENANLSFGGNVVASGDITTSQDYTLNDNVVVGSGDIDFSFGSLDMGSFNLTISENGYQPVDVDSIPSGYDIYAPEFDVSDFTSSGAIVVSGAILNFSSLGGANTITSSITLNDSELEFTNQNQLGSSTIRLNNSRLSISDVVSTADKNITNDITFNGNLYGATFAIGAGYEGVVTTGTFNTEFSGDVILEKDLAIKSGALSVPTIDFLFSGSLSGDGIVGFRSSSVDPLLKITASTNTSQLPSGTYTVTNGVETFEDDSPSTNLIVLPISTITINGERGDVVVSSGGRLEGTGTVAALLVQDGATVAPGLSPGCLSVGSGLTLNGEYEFEVDGSTVCTEYDQIDVTGAVDISGSSIVLSRDSAYLPALNTEFVLINNDAADAVTGEFDGWAQGAQVVVDQVTYEIDYAGGDGNDVVLTVVAIDSALAAEADTPDTGLQSVLANPMIGVATLVISAGSLALLKKKQLI